jgi:folate-binding protein YgfZ
VRPLDEAEGTRAALLAAGAAALDEAALEALRIQAGVARFGRDVDATRLPMEAALTAGAIAFDKGCYIGQEVVLRATARGHLQKGLVLLRLPAGTAPGAKLLAAGAEVGAVTSVAGSEDGLIGLGYAKRACWPAGTRLMVAASGAELGEATVVRTLVEEPAAKPGL